MFLQSIELENFKSFGKKTKIEFNNGFTVLSGPNGSGKSNISDAILFVLGPKSSKMIRAQKLTDLIFNGGKDRNAADYCKVSITFNNTDRFIPLDNDLVTFSRMVKLSEREDGYNSYFYINGDKAKLQDFTDLLSQARIFADGYNFVQQGDVTNIVEMTALERRRILEEIAGITKYDEEIQNAESKKKEVEENMNAIDLLLKEIEVHVATLSKDRDVALKYLEIKDRYNKAKAQLEYKRMKGFVSEIEGDEAEILKLKNEIEKLNSDIEEMNKSEESIKAKRSELDLEIANSGGEDVKKLKEQIDEHRIQLGRNKMKIEDLDDSIKRQKESVSGNEKDYKELLTKLKSMEQQRTNLSKEKEAKTQDYNAKKSILSEKEKKAVEYSDSTKGLQESLLKLYKDLENMRSEFTQKTNEFNKTKNKLDMLAESIAALEESKKNYELNITDAEWRLSESKNFNKGIEKNAKELQEQYFKLTNQEKSIKEEIEKIEKEILSLTKEYEKAQARIDSSKMGAGYHIISARDHNELKGIVGTVSELITVPDEYKVAMEIAAGARLDSIVVENDEYATKAIEYLKNKNLGRATFLPLNKMMIGRPRGKALLAVKEQNVLGFAIELIKFNKEYENAIWFIFGDTIIVRDMATARKLMGGIRIVTLDGQLFEASGAIIGGSIESRGSRVTMRDVEELGKKLRDKNSIRDDLENGLKNVENMLQDVTAKLRESAMKSNKAELEVWSKTKDDYTKKLNECVIQLKGKQEENDKFTVVYKSLENEITDLKNSIAKKVEESEKIKKSIEALTPEKLRNEIKKLNEELETLDALIKEQTKELSGLHTEISLLSEKIDTNRKQVENYNSEIKAKENELKEVEEQKRQTEQELQKLIEVEKSFNVKYQELIKKREEMDNKIISIDHEITRSQENVGRKQDFIISLNTRLKESQEKLEESKKIFEAFNIEITEPVPPVSELKKIVSDSETELKNLEPVNMKAIDDYNIEKERYDTLKSNYEKLEQERQDLIKLVIELNEKKKTGLMIVLKAVKENFITIYKEISEGGEADMYLENEEDPFSGGLVIKVKPKGKKFIRLEALSGGEKSLAALTFIFAIQKYEPSPIYILDEVDMFLDSVNAENVARIIRRNAGNAQFLVISLREVTLHYADYIIGVTSAMDGLSRTFSQAMKNMEVMQNGT
jgi:chromosome segregation protein